MPVFVFTREDGSTFEYDISLDGAFKLSEKHNLTYKRKEIPNEKDNDCTRERDN